MRRIICPVLFIMVICSPVDSAKSSPPLICDNSPEKKQIGLVLSGGGIKGAYQAGAAWYLVKIAGCNFDYYYGTSTGAVTAAILSQAGDLESLKQRVQEIVDAYKTIEHRSQLVTSNFLGLPRLLVPNWLGGIDGIYRLDPLADLLKYHEQLKLTRDGLLASLRTNLNVSVVSLQCGGMCLKSYRATPDNPFDFIVGSASIPIVVEPKRARIWLHATTIDRLEGAFLRLTSSDMGLPDPQCEIRFEGFEEGKRACVHLHSREDTTVHCKDGTRCRRWTTWFALPKLKDDERARINQLIKDKRNDNVYSLAKFTTIHQLVDGGVIDNVPLDTGVRSSGINLLFVLITGEYATDPARTEFHGVEDIAKNFLMKTYEAFESTSIRETIAAILYSKWYSEMISQGLHLQSTVGPLLDTLGRPALVVPKPVYLIEPQKRFFNDPFDTRKEAILNALYHGCAVASFTLRQQERSDGIYSSSQLTESIIRDSECNRMFDESELALLRQ